MRRVQIWYEAVQVVERRNGKLIEWFANDRFATMREARDQAKDLAKQFPGTEYQVFEVRLTELGEPIVGRVIS